jgi:4-carboxymuconolactone decarboxylase
VVVDDERYERGREKLREINEPHSEMMDIAYGDVAPDLVRHTIEFAYGEVLSRPQLDLKSRQLATVAGLIALGYAHRQLAFHIQGALNVGWTREEIVEVILQMAVYAGFPAALNAIRTAKEVFDHIDKENAS